VVGRGERLDVSFPDFPEVETSGEDLSEAINNAHSLLAFYLFDLEQREKPIRKPTLPHEVVVELGQFTSTVLVETGALESRFGDRYKDVKTVMSAWMYSRAKKAGLDFSIILESAVRAELGLQKPKLVYPLPEVEEPRRQASAAKGSYTPFVVLSVAVVGIFLGVLTFLMWGDIQERILSIMQSNEARVPFVGDIEGEEDEVEGEEAEEFDDFDDFDETEHSGNLDNIVEVATVAAREPRAHFLELRETFGNDDIVGQLLIEGTSIDYVVVQGEDNEFYLYHDLWGRQSSSGWVFVDYLADLRYGSQNWIIFGHNMAQDIMFHGLRNFRSREFFDRNSRIRFSTLYDDYEWEIFSFYQTNIDFPYLTVEFGDEWEYWLGQFAERSMHEVDVDLAGVDRILTLSTCTGADPDERYVVHARLVAP